MAHFPPSHRSLRTRRADSLQGHLAGKWPLSLASESTWEAEALKLPPMGQVHKGCLSYPEARWKGEGGPVPHAFPPRGMNSQDHTVSVPGVRDQGEGNQRRKFVWVPSPRGPLPSSFKIQGRNSNTESKPHVPSSKGQEPAARSRAPESCRAASAKRVSVRSIHTRTPHHHTHTC